MTVENENNGVQDTTSAEQIAPETTAQESTLAGGAGEQQPSLVDNNGQSKNLNTNDNENPAEPVVYDFRESIPEGMELDETTSNEFSEIARGLNLDNAQANQLASYGMAYTQRMMQALENQQAEQQKAWADETRQALGAKFNEEIGFVGTALDKLEPLVPGLRQALNIGGIGNRVEIVKALAQVGRMVAEDNGHAATDTSGAAPSGSRYPNTNFNDYK